MERSDVFLSYRRKDVDFVKQLDAALKNTGREVWVDWEDIPPGVEGFADEIQRGIEGADAFMAVLSPSYLESEYCLMELREALKLKKKIIPVVYQKFDPLPPPDGIGHINWVYFTPHAGQANTFAEAFPKVVQALEADFTHIREHTRLLLRALDWDKHQRNGSFLLNGTEIEKAESWQVAASSKDPVPTQLHGEYILLSRRRQRQQQQRLLLVIAGL
nr:toll/interleukin-1 receptor domain-containing protein [Anaerolineae bacterium]